LSNVKSDIFPNLTIRTAEKPDLPAICRLYAQPDFDNGKLLPLDKAEKLFDQIQSYPNYHIYVALNGTDIVGTFELLIMHNLGHQGASSGIVEDVVVDAAWQGKGVGKAMMRFAIECCRKAGCYKIALSANLKRKDAHRFYELLGFKKHGFSYVVEL
jgi:GNAT superfamily N-acetyltransferase